MRRREALKIQVGDRVVLKHNLGIGEVTRVAHEYHPRIASLHKDGIYPMIKFRQDNTTITMWSTYRVIRAWSPKIVLKSVKCHSNNNDHNWGGGGQGAEGSYGEGYGSEEDLY